MSFTDDIDPTALFKLSLNRLLPLFFSIGIICFYAHDAGSSSLWFDEAATYQFARLDWPTLGLALQHGDAFYGLYYAFMHLWISVFGSSEFMLRLPSVLFGSAALMLVYSLAFQLFGRSTAWITTFVIALNPFYYSMAREARGYTIFFFVSLVMSQLLLQVLDKPTKRQWIYYSLACIFGTYIHLFSVFIVIAHGIYVVCGRRKNEFIRYLFAAGACAVASLPLLWFTFHDDNSQNMWLQRPTLHSVRDLFFIWTGSHWLEHLALLFFVIAVGFFARNAWMKRSKHEVDSFTFAAIWLFLSIALVLLISQKKPIYYPRYMIGEFFPFAVIVSYGVKCLRFFRIIWPVFAIFLLLDFNAVHVEEHLEIQSWRESAQQLARDVKPGDAILLYPPRGYSVLEYYAPELAHGRNGVPIIYPQGGLPIWHSELVMFKPEDLVHETASRHKRVWLVLNGLSGSEEPGEAELDRALRKSYNFGPPDQLTCLSIVKLTRKCAC